MGEALANSRCVACLPDSPAVTEDERHELGLEIPDWEVIPVDGIPRLRRSYEFKDFAEALAFVNGVGSVAEEENHHPEMTVGWGYATVMWWTHTIRNLHRNDFVMAAKTDRIYRSR